VVATDSNGSNGRVYCWGENNSGQLGNNSTTDAKAPIAVSTTGIFSGKTIVDVAAGIQHSCALTSEGKVGCWGDNGSGQLGDNTTTDRKVPTAVYEEAGALLNAQVTALGGGANRSCAIANQKSYCWGLNTDGQLGDGTTTNRKKPTESVFLRPENNNFIY
jgi:alpha-tubulin suppressor-like RCC1 family protein